MNVGLHAVAAGMNDVYVDGSLSARWVDDPAFPRAYGSQVTMGSYGDPPSSYPHVDRIEFRAAPGGALLAADDFVSLAGWANAHAPFGGGTPWRISPAGFAHHGFGSGSAIYRTAGQPVGTTYVELQGVYFDTCPATSSFVGVYFDRNDGSDSMLGWNRQDGLGMAAGNEGRPLLISCRNGPSVPFAARAAGGWVVGAVT